MSDKFINVYIYVCVYVCVYIYVYIHVHITYTHTHVHLKKIEYREKVILFQKVKLSYILDSLHVK